MDTQIQARRTTSSLDHLGQITFLAAYLEHWGREAPGAVAATFYDHVTSRHGTTESVTFGQLDLWTRSLASKLASMTAPGERVAILVAQGLAYTAAFSACLRTHVVNVPLYAPDLPGQADRLQAVVADCTPSVILTTTDKLDLVREFCAAHTELSEDRILCVDAYAGDPDHLAPDYAFPDTVSFEDPAYLQYTSGSTRAPAGVILTHRNLIENAFQLREGHRLDFQRETCVSWLPLFHDMGLLIGICGPIVGGFESVLLDPVAFVLRPQRWLEALDGRREVMTAAPNFAFDYLVKRVKPEERERYDLSGVRSWTNGAEPILPATLDRFVEAFGPSGVQRKFLKPSYGLAEATVFVAATPIDEEPTIIHVDAEQLQHGVADPEDRGAERRRVPLVSSGVAVNQFLTIVDPDTRERLPEGRVGEIWLNGPNVGLGYWQKQAETDAVFGAHLLGAEELPADGWLRTEDLGTLIDGRLYVTGRIKDLIIVDGRNIYPHDLEFTVEVAHEAIAQHRLAAFAVASDTGESVVVVAERYRGADIGADDLAAVAAAARASVSLEHAVALDDFVLVEPNTILRTSSGKIARNATRDAYLAGTLQRTAG